MNKIMLYSDESCYIKNDGNNCMSLATIYLSNHDRCAIGKSLKEILKSNNILGEIKWGKISPSNVSTYKEIIKLVHNYVSNNKMRIRTLLAIVDKTTIEKKYNDWYHSMYYYLFRKVIDDKVAVKNLHLLIDKKDSHSHESVIQMAKYLENYSLWEYAVKATAEDSKDHIFIQIADIIAGATTYKFRSLHTSPAKLEIIDCIEREFKTNLIKSSPASKKDFNTFVWKGEKI